MYHVMRLWVYSHYKYLFTLSVRGSTSDVRIGSLQSQILASKVDLRAVRVKMRSNSNVGCYYSASVLFLFIDIVYINLPM